jgi:hypothetical protein
LLRNCVAGCFPSYLKKMVTLHRQNCARELIRTFIIIDLETTGLPYDKPVRITEIAMVAALREHILGYRTDVTCEVVLPRVLSKLTICVHPRRSISKRAAEMTRMLHAFCLLCQLSRLGLYDLRFSQRWL